MKKLNNKAAQPQGGSNQGEALPEVGQSPEGQEEAQNEPQAPQPVKEAFADRRIPGFTVKGHNAVCVKARLNTL